MPSHAVGLSQVRSPRNRHAQSGARLGSLRIERETFEPQLAGRAAALPALSRIASAQAYPTQSAVVGSKRVVDGLNVPGSIPVLPCVHKQHTASIAWMLQARPAATPAHAREASRAPKGSSVFSAAWRQSLAWCSHNSTCDDIGPTSCAEQQRKKTTLRRGHKAASTA